MEKKAENVMNQIDLMSVLLNTTFLSLTMRIVVHFLSYLSLDDGITNDTNQMLLDTPTNQPRITTTVPTHCSVTSSYQGHDEEHEANEEEEVVVVVNENNIDDNQQRQEEEEREDAPSSSSHNCDVGSTNIVVLSSTEKKLKHCYSSSTLLPPLIPRSSSIVTTTPMLQQHHHRSHHDAYRTLQLPVNSTNKLLIIKPNGQHQSTTTGSENNLQTTGNCLHSSVYNHHPHNSNSCFNEESVRTLSRGKSIFVTLDISYTTLNST